MIHIELSGSGARMRIENELWISRNRNGPVIVPHRCQAAGVGDGEQVWSLGELEGYPEARLITLAEYEEVPPDPDPELTAEEALNIIMGGNV